MTKRTGLGDAQGWERSRLEWHIADGGDPARLVEDFLAEHGLPVRDLAGGPNPAAAHTNRHRVVGASLYVSAAGAAAALGAPVGAPSPAPAVPDLVAVVWEPGTSPPAEQTVQSHQTPAHHPPGGWALGPWEPSWSPAAHAAAVTRARAAIGRGEVYQVNLVGHSSAGYHGDHRPVLRRVAALPGARYPGILSGHGWAVACASPETLVAVAGGRVRTGPIKGTRPATPAGRTALLRSAKERAEHVMIVDLARNDLARVARTGSVRVDALYTVQRWCDLWQAESVVSGALADGVGLADLLRATCPGGSVTGAPKLAALRLVAGLEPVGRGASMGAFGWVDHTGLDLGLTIRTVAVDARRVHVWAGGGITWGSDPAAEVAEAAAKAAPLRAALHPAPAAATAPR